MSIPTRFDGQIAELDCAAANIVNQLRILRRSNNPRDLDRYRRQIREQLQDFANTVMELANE